MLNALTSLTFANIFRLLTTFFILLPLTTFFLTKEELGFLSFYTVIFAAIINMVNTSGNLLINSYFHKISNAKFETIISHIYYAEFFIKIIITLIIIAIYPILTIYYPSSVKDVSVYAILGSIVLASTRPYFYQFLSVKLYTNLYSVATLFEILITISFIYYCLTTFTANFESYCIALVLSNSVLLCFELLILSKYFKKINKIYLILIFKKGIKYSYGALLENLNQIFEAKLIASFVSITNVAIYNHAKMYILKFSVIDKSIYQSVTVFSLNRDINSKDFIARVNQIWYTLILIIGIFIIFFSDALILFITNGKLAEAAVYLKILFVMIFIRSLNQHYNIEFFREANLSRFIRINSCFVVVNILLSFLMFKYTSFDLLGLALLQVIIQIIKLIVVRLTIFRMAFVLLHAEKWCLTSILIYIFIFLLYQY